MKTLQRTAVTYILSNPAVSASGMTRRISRDHMRSWNIGLAQLGSPQTEGKSDKTATKV